MRNLIRSASVLLAVCSSWDVATAQFPGDVFFTEPSVAVVPGGSTTLQVEVFSGVDVFGATAFDVLFDSAAVRVDAVRPAIGGSLTARVSDVAGSAGHAVAVFNDGSLIAPSGSIAMIELDVTPLVGVGQSVQLTLSPRAMLRPDGTAFPQSNGFSAVVDVVSPGPMAATSGGPPSTERHRGAYEPWVDPLYGAVPFRRPGHVLIVHARGPGSSFGSWRRIQTYDPFAGSER